MKLKFIQSSLLVLSLFFVQFANAQGTYNLSFAQNCSGASPQFCVDLNIQADAATNMGAYTVFFSYNTAAIDNPTYTSASFSGDGTCYRAFDMSYDNNDGVVNLTVNTINIQPTTAEACSAISTTETTMGTFCFDVMDNMQTAGLVFDSGVTLFNQYNNDPVTPLTQGMLNGYDGAVTCAVAECRALSVSELSSDINTDNGLVVTLSWAAIPNAEGYQLAGRKVGGPVKVFPEFNSQTLSRQFTSGIQYNTSYEWSIRVKCDGVWTAYALDGPGPAAFTTPASSAKNTSDFDIFESTTELQVNLYPNPARDNVNVQFETPMLDFNSNSTLNINVYDVVGRQLLVKKVETHIGQISLNLAGFDKGYYFVEVDNGITKAVEKLAVY